MNFTKAFRLIFSFFVKQELKAKRLKIFLALSAIPVAILIITKIYEISSPYSGVTASEIFSKVMFTIYIQVMAPILALLYGAMTINEEVDNKTLVFLTTAPIPRESVVTGKYTAYSLIAIGIILTGLIVSFFTININHLGSITYTKEFFVLGGALIAAILAYMAFFTLIGSIMKKFVVLGFLYIFSWESFVHYLPGITQKFTIMHWIKSLLPKDAVAEKKSILQFLMAQQEPSSTFETLLVLSLIIIIGVVGAAIIFKNKEYIMSDAI